MSDREDLIFTSGVMDAIRRRDAKDWATEVRMPVCELTTKEFLRVVQGRPDPVQESPNVFRPWYTLTEQPDVFDLSGMD